MLINSLSFIKALTLDFLNFSKLEVKHHFDPFFFKIEGRTLYLSPRVPHSGTFAYHKYKELSYPKNPRMCDFILVTLLKMRPHYSQSGRENAIPSIGTSPLASYNEISPPRKCESLNT